MLLHHELDVELNGQVERHTATLLAFGETAEGCSQRRPESAMARTVGIPAAIAAEVRCIGINVLLSALLRNSVFLLMMMLLNLGSERLMLV